MARHFSFRILIGYEAFERFAAIIRPQQMAEWEQPIGLNDMVSVIGHPEFHCEGHANDQRCDPGDDLREVASPPTALPRRPQDDPRLDKRKDET